MSYPKAKQIKANPQDAENYIASLVAENDRLCAAINNYLSVFDRCGGSESISPEAFAMARGGLRLAVGQHEPSTPTEKEDGNV